MKHALPRLATALAALILIPTTASAVTISTVSEGQIVNVNTTGLSTITVQLSVSCLDPNTAGGFDCTDGPVAPRSLGFALSVANGLRLTNFGAALTALSDPTGWAPTLSLIFDRDGAEPVRTSFPSPPPPGGPPPIPVPFPTIGTTNTPVVSTTVLDLTSDRPVFEYSVAITYTAQVSQVPAPAGMALLATALPLLATQKRRRRRPSPTPSFMS